MCSSDLSTLFPFHPNGMEFRAYDEAGTETARWLVYSIGGGALAEEKANSPQTHPNSAGGDACVPGQAMVRPGDRTSLKKQAGTPAHPDKDPLNLP